MQAQLTPPPDQLAGTPTVGVPSPDEAVAYAVALALGEDLPPAERMAALQGRLEALRDPTAPAALAELTRQLPLLDSLFQRLSVDALRATGTERRTKLLKAAVYAQTAYARTFALVRTLAAPGSAGVVDVH